VIRRGIQFCLMSLSLLALVPAPFASASVTPHDDCCPASQHVPCNPLSGSLPAVPVAISCCAAVPAPLPAVAEVVSARARAKFIPVVTPAHFSLPAPSAQAVDHIALDLPASSADIQYARVSEPIYLLTRRLRL
jgi:hypothetical protein